MAEATHPHNGTRGYLVDSPARNQTQPTKGRTNVRPEAGTNWVLPPIRPPSTRPAACVLPIPRESGASASC